MPIKKAPLPEYPILAFETAARWAEWLEANHGSERGVWLRLAKKDSGIESVSRADALDVALCYGWIDGQAKSSDPTTWLQKFTPRGKKSLWSKRNREHVDRLIASGQMRPAGEAAIEAAKADGRWDRAYDAPSTATVPDDFRAALEQNPAAADFFETLTGQARYSILFRIQTAVKAETRARRIAELVAMLEQKQTLQ